MEWKDRSVVWVPLKDLKQPKPVELAEYSVASEISYEPALNWWVVETLQHINTIISKVNFKYWRTSHKSGIRLTKTEKEVCDIDRQYGTDFWTKAIAKDMKNDHIEFEKLGGITPD